MLPARLLVLVHHVTHDCSSSSTMSAPGAGAAGVAVGGDGVPGAGAGGGAPGAGADAANNNTNGGNSASQSSGGPFSRYILLLLLFLLLALYCYVPVLDVHDAFSMLLHYCYIPDIHDAHDAFSMSLVMLHVVTRSPYTAYAMIIVLTFWIKIYRFMTIFSTAGWRGQDPTTPKLGTSTAVRGMTRTVRRRQGRWLHEGGGAGRRRPDPK